MGSRKALIATGLIGMLLIGVVTPVTAHETQNVEGYDITFGGANEPLITGERMWLEIEIVDNESGDPVEGQADTLNLYVQNSGNDRGEINLSEKHGEDGVYEASVIFTESGDYTVHLEGSIEDTEVHTHFEKEVQDHTELEYPTNDSQVTDNGNKSQTDANQTDESGFGTMSIAIAAISVIMTLGMVLLRQQR